MEKLRHLDGRIRVWRKQHEGVNPSCLVPAVQAPAAAAAAGEAVLGTFFSQHTFGPSVQTEHC